MEELMLAIGRFCLRLVGWKPKAQRVYEQMIEKQIRPGLPHRYLDGRVCGCADCRVAMAFDPFGTRQIDRNKSYPDWPRVSDEATTAMEALTKAAANTGITLGVSGMTLNQTLLSMGQDPIPGDNLTRGEIAERNQSQPRIITQEYIRYTRNFGLEPMPHYDDEMLAAPPDWMPPRKRQGCPWLKPRG